MSKRGYLENKFVYNRRKISKRIFAVLCMRDEKSDETSCSKADRKELKMYYRNLIKILSLFKAIF